MTLRFIEGFDDSLVDDELGKWDTVHSSVIIDESYGRTGKGARLRSNTDDTLVKQVPADDTYVVGYAVVYGAGGAGVATLDNLSFREDADSSTTHVAIRFDGVNNRVLVYRGSGSTLLGSSDNGTFTRNVTHYVETKVFVDNSAGTVEVYVDGVQVIDLTGQDTQNGGTGVITYIGFGANSGSSGYQYVDDIYMLDSQGSTNNDFIGECTVQTVFPDGDDTNEDWTTSTGSDSYALVDEDPPNGDTDYISSDTAGEITDLTYQNLTDIGQTIFGVQPAVVARRDSGTTRNVRNRVLSNGSTGNGDDHTPIDGTYQAFTDMFELDPDGSTAWDVTAVNAAVFGVEARD